MSTPSPGDLPAEPAPPPPVVPGPPAAAVPPAGWYADPAGGGWLRYWDGAAWTEHTSAVPAAAPAYGTVPAYAVPAHGYTGYAGQPRSVGFTEAVRLAFRNWTDYGSRSTRSEYWWFYLFQALAGMAAYVVLLVVVGILAAVADPSTGGSGSSASSGGNAAAAVVGVVLALLFLAYVVVLFLVTLPLTVRRLHDTSRSGWWYLITLVPFGGIVLIVFLAMESTPGPNEYGPFPT